MFNTAFMFIGAVNTADFTIYCLFINFTVYCLFIAVLLQSHKKK